MQPHKFKIGDKVRVNLTNRLMRNERFQNMTGNIIAIHNEDSLETLYIIDTEKNLNLNLFESELIYQNYFKHPRLIPKKK